MEKATAEASGPVKIGPADRNRALIGSAAQALAILAAALFTLALIEYAAIGHGPAMVDSPGIAGAANGNPPGGDLVPDETTRQHG